MAHSGPARAEVRRVNPDDIAGGMFDEGIELVLTLAEAGRTTRVDTTYAGAHAVRDALASTLHEHAGKSIVQKLEGELDEVMVMLMEPDEPEDQHTEESRAETRGWARGLATAIALMRGIDMDAVRAEAMTRYEECEGS